MTASPTDLQPIMDRLDRLEREVAELKKHVAPAATTTAKGGTPMIEPGTPGASPHAREVTGGF